MDALAYDFARRTTIEDGLDVLDDPANLSDERGLKPGQSSTHGAKGQFLLEHLPPEVRRHLLSTMELTSLRALVGASPIFHQQYLHDRHYVLCRSLEHTLGSVAVDALAVHLYDPEQSREEDYSVEFLQSYSDKLSSRNQRLVGRLTLEEAQGMAGFYLGTIEPIAQRFAHDAKQRLRGFRLSGSVAGERVQSDDANNLLDAAAAAAANSTPPSQTEMLRLSRALYRFHLLCELVEPAGSQYWSQYRSLKLDRLQTLLGTLHPWETEEVFSIYQFMQNVYGKVFDDIAWDVHPQNPKNSPGGQEQDSKVFHLENDTIRKLYLEGTAFRGLELLRTILFDIEDREHLVSTMRTNIVEECFPFDTLAGIMGEQEQAWTRANRPSARDQMEIDRLPSPFEGDDLSQGPPLAWTVIWRDTYCNLYGWFIPDEMRQWGYVFWDSRTLHRTGALDVLEQQWQQAWQGEDPRDTYSRPRLRPLASGLGQSGGVGKEDRWAVG